MITQSELKEKFRYSLATGAFTYLTKAARRTKIGAVAGTVNSKGYVDIKINGKTYKAHRLSFLYVNGGFPINEVDHINHIKNDNRWSNLREVTHKENGKNQPLNKTNTSGISGVYQAKDCDRWITEIRPDLKRIYLGLHRDFFEACCIRKSAEIKYNFHENHGQVAKELEK